MKFRSEFFRNGSLKTGSVQVLKSLRTQQNTEHHEYNENVTSTRLIDWRTPTSIQAQNFGFWCNNSMKIHLVLNYLEAIEHCKNMESFVCKWFQSTAQYYSNTMTKRLLVLSSEPSFFLHKLIKGLQFDQTFQFSILLAKKIHQNMSTWKKSK